MKERRAEMLEFHVLGPIEVRRAGLTVALGGPQRQTLLACLLAHADEAVSADALIRAVWRGEPPENATAMLRSLVAHVRRALTDAGDGGQERLVSVPGGYRLTTDDALIDAVEFERAVGAAAVADDDGDGRAVLAAVESGLAWWRGAPFGAFGTLELIHPVAARFEELRGDLAEFEVAALVKLRRHADAIVRVGELIDAYPFREQLRELQVLALYRSGRQADALAAYDDYQAFLADELGYKPGEALEDLVQQVLRHDPDLEDRTRSADQRKSRWLPALAVDQRFPFTGRVDELDQLNELMRCVREDDGRVVLVTGEPGIGKTRLVIEALRGLDEPVLIGRCTDDPSHPYRPFVELLRQYIDGLDGGVSAAALGPGAAELISLIPELAALVDASPTKADPDTERLRLHEAVSAWLRLAAASRPLVLFVDDLQWAPLPTWRLFAHLADDLPPGVLLIATLRHPVPGLDGQVSREIDALIDRKDVEHLRIGGLAVHEVEALAGSAGLRDEMEVDAADLHEDTAGNPFYLNALLAEAARTGVMRVPDSVRATVAARLRSLGEDTRKFLVTAAVAGPEFDIAVASAAAGLPVNAVANAVDEARGYGFLAERRSRASRQYFAHEILRSTVLDSVSSSRRLRIHHRVALALERQYGADEAAPEIAGHLLAAGDSGDPTRAVEYARRAGAIDEQVHAYDDAVRLYEQALALVPADDDDLRCQVTLDLGRALLHAGRGEHRSVLFESAALAERLGDPERLAAAALLTRGNDFGSVIAVDDEVVALMERALVAIGATTPPTRARLLAALSAELTWGPDRERRHRLSVEALDIARHVGDVDTLAFVIASRCQSIWDPETFTERCKLIAELERIGEERDDPQLRWFATKHGFVTAIEGGDRDAAAETLILATDLLRSLGNPTARWEQLCRRAHWARLCGDFESAESLTQAALDVGQESDQPDALAAFGMQTYFLELDRGRIDRLLPMIETMLEASVGTHAHRAIAAALAVGHIESGRHEDARAVLTDLGDDGVRMRFEPNGLLVGTMLAEAWGRLGDVHVCKQFVEHLEPYADRIAATGYVSHGSVARVVGLLHAAVGDRAAAIDAFARAESIEVRFGNPAWEIRTALERARALLQGDPAGGREVPRLLDHVARLADSYGLEHMARRVEGLRENVGV